MAAMGAEGRDAARRAAQDSQPAGRLSRHPPPPGPIAVIKAGLPIEDVIAKLTAVQADHPGAKLRQGKRNRWEIWQPEQPPGQ